MRVLFLSVCVKPPPEQEIPKEEQDKYQEEFQNFQQELDKKKEEFQKEHPDVQGQPRKCPANSNLKSAYYNTRMLFLLSM